MQFVRSRTAGLVEDLIEVIEQCVVQLGIGAAAKRFSPNDLVPFHRSPKLI
jgi:hypothetical protein